MNDNERKGGESTSELSDIPSKINLTILYGSISASIHTDNDKFTALITGAIKDTGDLPFHQFLVRFIKSMEKAYNYSEPV